MGELEPKPRRWAARADDELDLTRLAELQQLLGTDLPEIVATLVGELDAAVSELERAIGAGELEAAALAAHSARSSALMIGSEPLLHTLRQLETGALGGSAPDAAAGLGRLSEAWSELRLRLEHLP